MTPAALARALAAVTAGADPLDALRAELGREPTLADLSALAGAAVAAERRAPTSAERAIIDESSELVLTAADLRRIEHLRCLLRAEADACPPTLPSPMTEDRVARLVAAGVREGWARRDRGPGPFSSTELAAAIIEADRGSR